MKQEKDKRITAPDGSVRLYLVIFFTFGIFDALRSLMIWIFIKNDLPLLQILNDVLSSVPLVITIIVHFMFYALLTLISAFFREFELIKPLKKLGAAAQKIAKGDFSVRVDSRRKDGKKGFVEVFIDDFNSMAEELAVANEKLKALATTDELTKLDNRRSFLEHIDLIWKQNHRLNLPVTIVMIDIDYFKKYNDSLGHLEGDKALIAVAQCLKNNIKRETDFVARFGGEEFVCVLPFIEKDEALEFSKKMVQSVEEMKMPHPMSVHSKYVTISAGMAIAVPNDTNSYSQLLDEADKALYSAKESGRNRVVMN